MRKVTIALALVAAAGLTVRTASAQTAARPIEFGGEVNWATDTDFGLGARVAYTALGNTIGLAGLEGVASLDFFFPGSGVTYFEVNANVTYPLRLPSVPTISPYFGGGLNIAHASGGGASSTDVGLNVLGGTRFGLGTLKAFGEGRLELHSGSQFVLTFGLLF